MKVNISDEAKNDIVLLRKYIALDNESAADRLAGEILDCIAALSSEYNSGFKLSNHTQKKTAYRFRIVKPYLVFYKMRDDTVFVSRVLHASTNYLKILDLKK